MNQTFSNALAIHGATLVTYIGLKNAAGVELLGGGYARLPVTWTRTNNVLNPSGNLVFTTEAGDEVASWCGFSALTGGTDYGGEPVTERDYNNPGTYTLLAASTNITIG